MVPGPGMMPWTLPADRWSVLSANALIISSRWKAPEFSSETQYCSSWAVGRRLSVLTNIWLMKSDRSATAFFMSPPRAWEFLIGGLIATPGFPVLRNALAQQIARGIALVLIAIPIFSLRQGPGFPGFNALTPCIGAAMFLWSGIDVPTQTLWSVF